MTVLEPSAVNEPSVPGTIVVRSHFFLSLLQPLTDSPAIQTTFVFPIIRIRDLNLT